MKHAFVTGGYGLLGYWLVRALLERDVHVVVLKRDDVRASALVLDGLEERCTVVRGDVRDVETLDRAIGEYRIDSVFHLAAQSIVGTARRSPAPTFHVNVRGTWELLEACRRHEVGRTVVAASARGYGAGQRLPLREDDPLLGQGPYEVSKSAADMIARSYWHAYGIPVATTRFANLYGGGDLTASRLVPESVSAVLAGRAPVIRSDGTPERDFLYAEDAASAYLAIADALDGDGARGEAFNAGGMRPHSVREVVSLVCRAAGAELEPDVRGEPRDAWDIDRQYVDTTKLRELTGWAPGVSLAEGLRRTVDWYRAHPEALAQLG